MEIKTAFLVGGVRYEYSFNEPKEIDTLHKAIVLSNPKNYCALCKNNDKDKFVLDSNKDNEGNTYVNIVCRGCGAKSKLGQYKTGGYFWRDFVKFEKQSSSTTNTQTKSTSREDLDELL